MRVGLWRSEFEKVEDGFKIAITEGTGKSWTRLEKTDSLKNAQKAFRNFAEFWVNGTEPSSLQGLGHSIRDRHDAETAIADSSEFTRAEHQTTCMGNQPALLREQPPLGSPATSREEYLPTELPAVSREEQLRAELPAVSREEQLRAELPAVSREEQLRAELPAVLWEKQLPLPQEWDNAPWRDRHQKSKC